MMQITDQERQVIVRAFQSLRELEELLVGKGYERNGPTNPLPRLLELLRDAHPDYITTEILARRMGLTADSLHARVAELRKHIGTESVMTSRRLGYRLSDEFMDSAESQLAMSWLERASRNLVT